MTKVRNVEIKKKVKRGEKIKNSCAAIHAYKKL